MALAIPGGAPGYDDDKQFGNFITHMAARTSSRLRKHSGETPEVKGSRRSARSVQLSRVPGISRERKCWFQPCVASSPSFRDAPLGAGPESILPMVVKEGFARFTRAPE